MQKNPQDTSDADTRSRAPSPLIQVLRGESNLGAIHLDPEQRLLRAATLGAVDWERLREMLRNAIREIDARGAQTVDLLNESQSAGMHARREGDTLVIERPSCFTAPQLWVWREIPWPEEDAGGEEPEDWRVLASLAAGCGLLAAAAFMLEQLSLGPSWVASLLFAAAYICGGWDAFHDVRRSIVRGKVDIHFLMLAVAVGAAAIGAWGEGALLLFLFSAAGAMEHFAMHRTRREIGALFHLSPKEALRIDSARGTEESVPIDAIAPGDRLRIPPGALFPVDGLISDGESAADESTITGESLPVSKLRGSEVQSGTINLWGSVEMVARCAARESSLQQIIRLIRDARQSRAPSQRFTDRFGTRYTILVLGTVTAMFFVWWLGLGLPPFVQVEGGSAFYRAMTLLVVASPCALVLSIPSAILAAIAWGARRGILFRGGAAIERLADIDTLAIDKTGTLSSGELEVATVESFPSGRECDVAELAHSIERKASHPIARALVRYGVRENLQPRPISSFRAYPGLGVRGTTGTAGLFVGSREALRESSLSDWIDSVSLPPPIHSEVWVVSEDLVGRILLRDHPRVQSGAVLAQLRADGRHTVMLTGDRVEAACALAREIGLPDACVRAGLRPEDKVAVIRGLTEEGKTVAMIGDGVNDAPSLAAAHVSIAMGAGGSDAAMEQSDIVLMHDRIENVVSAIRLSEAARRVIRQNLAIALGAVVTMSVAALFGLIPLSVGVLVHEGSTVLVCLNSLRLLFLKAPHFSLQPDENR